MFRRAVISALRYLLSQFLLYWCSWFLLVNGPDLQFTVIVRESTFTTFPFTCTSSPGMNTAASVPSHYPWQFSSRFRPAAANRKNVRRGVHQHSPAIRALCRLSPSSAPLRPSSSAFGHRTVSASCAAPPQYHYPPEPRNILQVQPVHRLPVLRQMIRAMMIRSVC